MKIKIDKNALWDYLCNEGLAVLNNKNPGNDYNEICNHFKGWHCNP